MSDLVSSYKKEYGKTPSEKDLDYIRFLERRKSLMGMQVLDRPVMHPAKCINCDAGSNDRKYVDFGKDIDDFGVIYICSICVGETWRYFNFPKKDDGINLDAWKQRINQLYEYNKSLTDIVADLSEEIDHLKEEMDRVYASSRNNSNPPISKSGLNFVRTEESGSAVQGSNSDIDTAKPGITK